ncbi:uncharacterized protein LOC114301219 [Camellia sinensis]|uniref:uncharacterized protein LOC114301219 n=1 Tax=Camellia sinensis TaxID=4442 RepID=UPI001035BD93|nr:uncharacterized protein LOC114301219 [Camellia sinensis]
MTILMHKPTFKLTKWNLPPAGKIKLNIDGNRKLGGGEGFGGLFRDEREAWVYGYYGKFHNGSLQRVNNHLQKGMHNVIIEIDAEQVVQLMEADPNDKFPFKGLVEDAKIL